MVECNAVLEFNRQLRLKNQDPGVGACQPCPVGCGHFALGVRFLSISYPDSVKQALSWAKYDNILICKILCIERKKRKVAFAKEVAVSAVEFSTSRENISSNRGHSLVEACFP